MPYNIMGGDAYEVNLTVEISDDEDMPTANEVPLELPQAPVPDEVPAAAAAPHQTEEASMPACEEVQPAASMDASIPAKDSTEVPLESCQVEKPALPEDGHDNGGAPREAPILQQAAHEEADFDVMNYKEHACIQVWANMSRMTVMHTWRFERHGTCRTPSLELIKPRL